MISGEPLGRGVYFQKFNPPLFASGAYLGQRSGQNTLKEWSEHKINAIFELSTLENPCKDSLFKFIYEFNFFSTFYILESYA